MKRALWLVLALALAACAMPSHAEARLMGNTEVELRVTSDQQSLYLTVWVTQHGDRKVQFDSGSLVLSLAHGARVLRSEVFYSPYPSPGAVLPRGGRGDPIAATPQP
jgi:hypothetical protein